MLWSNGEAVHLTREERIRHDPLRRQHSDTISTSSATTSRCRLVAGCGASHALVLPPSYLRPPWAARRPRQSRPALPRGRGRVPRPAARLRLPRGGRRRSWPGATGWSSGRASWASKRPSGHFEQYGGAPRRPCVGPSALELKDIVEGLGELHRLERDLEAQPVGGGGEL
ncbi:hypothetical protein CTA2_3400 [Colletotrichum tanaceti]|nr:hypothetical protein CTA2_3400 [Colletotrichum tanaceti]